MSVVIYTLVRFYCLCFWVHIWTGLEFFIKFKVPQKSMIFYLTSFIIPFKNLVNLILSKYSAMVLGIFKMCTHLKLHFLLSGVIRE